jgi:NAD(P)-dependent dehydrogenase (short-subunit alcohol dehydrogenase family)
MRRVVAITGGARGLGLATATELAGRGCRVAIGDLDADLARAEAAALPGDGHAGYALDVTADESFEVFLYAVERELGPLDVLINNAGIMPVAPVLQERPQVIRAQVEINLMGVITGTRLALARMVPRGHGHVVNLASGAGKVPVAGEATYSATKHAVVGFDEALMGELAGTGVHVTTVMPSLANTELAAGLRPPRFVPLVEPGQVARAIARAIERPRLDVFVPAWTGPIVRLQLMLPTPLRAWLRRLFRIETVAADIDTTARAGYVERTTRV